MSDDVLERVTWWADEAASSKGERDNTIREAVASGYSLRTVAEAASLSHAAVARIAKR